MIVPRDALASVPSSLAFMDIILLTGVYQFVHLELSGITIPEYVTMFAFLVQQLDLILQPNILGLILLHIFALLIVRDKHGLIMLLCFALLTALLELSLITQRGVAWLFAL